MNTLQPTSYTEINRMHGNALGLLEGSLVVTGTREGEGSSLLAYTMALRSAENGTPTLLVDLNMKNSALSMSLDIERRPWHLPAQGPELDLSKLIEADKEIKTLNYLAAPLDAESVNWLKDYGHAKKFFDALSKKYQQVIVDTTPIGLANRANADPVILASAASRTIMVVLAGVTPRQQVKKALAQLEKSGAHIEGVVLNDWQNPSFKDDLLRLAGDLQKSSPGLASWLRHKVLHSESLS
jgi:Mrp family chromosome partitioning ATPase